jgi:rod shape-determining protein MreC
MKILRLIYLYKDGFALVIASFLSLIIFFTNDSVKVRAVQADIADVTSILTSPQKWYNDVIDVKEENKFLAQRIVLLQLLNTELIHCKNENDSLKKMLKFTQDSPLSLKPANIVNHNFSSLVQSITIDIGEDENIFPNLGVLDMNGLLGKTIAVGDRATQIQLITDKNFRVSIRAGEERILGIYKPTHGKYGVLSGIPKSANISLNDLVVTSGISDIYPQNIPVAKVISTTNYPNRAFLEVVVEVVVDIQNMNYVFIIQ